MQVHGMVFCTRCSEPVRGWTCQKCNAVVQESDPDWVSDSVEALWKDFCAEFYIGYHPPHLLEAASILGEAARCCRDGQYLASALMCRTALESGLYWSRISHAQNGISKTDPGVVELMPDVQFQWYRVMEWAIRRGFIDKELGKDGREVRELGNFAAHLSERVMRSAFSRPNESYKLWIRPEEAYWALNITKQIILGLRGSTQFL